MGATYPVLRYPSNISGWDTAQPGALLGYDELGTPYEVIDSEYIECDDDECAHTGKCGHTNVYLQYATAQTLKNAVQTQEKTT